MFLRVSKIVSCFFFFLWFCVYFYNEQHCQMHLVSGKMLGQILVTKQTGAQGKVVSKVCILLFTSVFFIHNQYLVAILIYHPKDLRF